MIEYKLNDNPRSLAYNEQHEFTRRIPSLKPRQAARDGRIATQIARAIDVDNDTEKAMDIFFNKCRLLSNPHYWELLRTVWIMCGSTDNADVFRPYLQSSRPCRGWFMTKEDTEALDAMRWPLTVYRAYDDEEDHGISWTLDREWCEIYAKEKGRKVKSRTVERNDVFAYVSRRGEEEIMIL